MGDTREAAGTLLETNDFLVLRDEQNYKRNSQT